MSGKKENFDDFEFFLEQNVHFDSRTIMIGSPYSFQEENHGINSHIAANVIKSLHLLRNQNNLPIEIYLMTEGGCFYSGMAIYDFIKETSEKCIITIKGVGKVMSAGSIVLQAATPGHRLLYPNTTIMLHDGSPEGAEQARSGENWSDYGKKQRNKVYHIFASGSGEKADFFRKRMMVDWVMSAEQAVDYGLADAVIGE